MTGKLELTMARYLKPVLLVAATGTLLHFSSDYFHRGTGHDEVTWYSHDNRNLPVVDQCTQEERSRIVSQLVLDSLRIFTNLIGRNSDLLGATNPSGLMSSMRRKKI